MNTKCLFTLLQFCFHEYVWHLPRTMVILKGLDTPCCVNLRKMRWPHELPYRVMMIMSFQYLHETHETYDHIQLRRSGNLPSRWIDVQSVLSSFPCYYPLSSTFIFLFAMSSSFSINILFPLSIVHVMGILHPSSRTI